MLQDSPSPDLADAAPAAPEQDIYDVIVLGAGVSGLTAAAVLAERGLSVCLIDEYAQAGGNHRSWQVDDCTFDIGAIFFWPDNPLFQIFPRLLQMCVPVEYRLSKLTPQSRVVNYPFDFKRELAGRNIALLVPVLLEILYRRLFQSRRFNSANDFILYYIGQTLYRITGLIYYFDRFYGLRSEAVSCDFADQRMRWLSDRAGVRRRARRIFDDLRSPRPRQSLGALARPKSGFAAMYQVALAQLAERRVRVLLATQLVSVTPAGAEFHVGGAGIRLKGRRLISTIPLARTLNLFGVLDAAPPPSSTMVTLFCKFRGERKFSSVVLYNFHKKGRWKRLTFHSDYYGYSDNWQYCSVEVIEKSIDDHAQILFDDFKESVQSANLFCGEIVLVGHARTDFAYPVLDRGAATKRDACRAALLALGVELIGRQGKFEYMASSRSAVEAVLVAL